MNDTTGSEISRDFKACRAALEAGQAVWLLEEGNVYISRVRKTNGGYELTTHAGNPVLIASLTYDEKVPPLPLPDIQQRDFQGLDELMKELESTHQAWSTDRDAFAKRAPYSWDVDFLEGGV